VLKGIRCLLYGVGSAIRGVQRILKERGIGAVQRLAMDRQRPRSARPKKDDTCKVWPCGYRQPQVVTLLICIIQ
jgi:hypothetical protein